MDEQRNQYGFPVADKLMTAKQYAAGAALRKQERECQCQRCKDAEQEERLAAVLNIIAARQ